MCNELYKGGGGWHVAWYRGRGGFRGWTISCETFFFKEGGEIFPGEI